MKNDMDAKSVGPNTNLRELFKAFPKTREVFRDHGMGEQDLVQGPNQTIQFFCTVHGLATEEILAEVRIRLPRELFGSS